MRSLHILEALVPHDGDDSRFDADPHAEEQAAYRRKMGRWKRETKETIQDQDFWLALYVFSISHGPLEHALNFIHSTDNQFKYAMWVCGKSMDISCEFGQLLASPVQWCKFVLSQIGTSASDSGTLHLIWELAVGLIMAQHSSFKRRAQDFIDSYPARALWLAHTNPDVKCRARKAVATEILNSCVERNMVKLRKVLKSELEYASETGCCKLTLYFLIRSWYEGAPIDVSINETHNSFIRRECERNRHICLPLLSSRCNARYDLKLSPVTALPNVVGRPVGGQKKWSTVRPNAFKVLQARGVRLRLGVGKQKPLFVSPFKLRYITRTTYCR